MSYRIEIASSGRAGCQSTECKKESVKIGKNELRLGTWVDIPDRGGSWRWRHWGCVTGKILQNIRQALDQQNSGNYSWEALDGYEGCDDKNSLHNYPDLQVKVRRVITQGFIDPEDFKGDAEMNKLGCTGLRLAASKKKKLQQDNENHSDLAELKNQVDQLAAQRKSILSKGGSLSKIDAQLRIIEDALAEAEGAKLSQEIPLPPKKKAKKKRGPKTDQSEEEDLNDLEHEVELPPKKKRISAKDRIAMEKSKESKPIESLNIKNEAENEDMQRPTDASKKRNKSVPMKIKKEQENDQSDDIGENIKHDHNKKKRIKKEANQEEPEAFNKSRGNKKAVVAKKPIKKEDNHYSDLSDSPQLKPTPKKRGRPKKRTGLGRLSDQNNAIVVSEQDELNMLEED